MTGETPDWLKGAEQRKFEVQERERLRLAQEEEQKRIAEEKRINLYGPLAEDALALAQTWENLKMNEALQETVDFMDLESTSISFCFSVEKSHEPNEIFTTSSRSRDELKQRLANHGHISPTKSKFLFIEQQTGRWHHDTDYEGSKSVWFVCKWKFQLTSDNLIIRDTNNNKLSSLGECRTPEELRQKLGQFVTDSFTQN